MPVIKLNYTNAGVHDTYISSGAPTTNYNASTTLLADADAIQEILLKIDINLIPNNAIINSAVLTLTPNAYGDRLVNIYNVLSDWNDLTVTWNTKPTYDTSPAISIRTPTSSSEIFNIDITALTQSWVNGTKNYGIALTTTAISGVGVYSNENSTAINKPYLTIDYSIPTTDKKQVEVISTDNYIDMTAATSNTIPISNVTRTNGDLIAIYILTLNNIPVTSYPTGWTILDDSGTESTRFTVLYKFVDGTETDVLVGFSSTTTVTAHVAVYRNVRTITRLGQTVGYTSGDKYLSLSNVPINSLLVYFGGLSGTTTVNPPLNFIEQSVYAPTSGNTEYNFCTYNYDKTTYGTDATVDIGSTTAPNKLASLVLVPITNEAPHIDGTDSYLGEFSVPVTKTYTVTDTEGDTVTITEKLNGTVLRTLNAGGTYTLDLTAQWSTLDVGLYTITVEANDNYADPPHEPRVRTWTFRKLLASTDDLATAITKSDGLITYFNYIKQKLVDRIGGVITDKFEDIIKNTTARRSANGLVTSSGVVAAFNYTNGTTANSYYVTVTGLTFKPSAVILKGTAGGSEYVTVYDEFDGGLYPKSVKTAAYTVTANSATVTNIKGDSGAASIDAGGFTLPVGISNQAYSWEAIE